MYYKSSYLLSGLEPVELIPKVNTKSTDEKNGNWLSQPNDQANFKKRLKKFLKCKLL